MLLNSKQLQLEIIAILKFINSVTHNADLIKDLHNLNQTYSSLSLGLVSSRPSVGRDEWNFIGNLKKSSEEWG